MICAIGQSCEKSERIIFKTYQNKRISKPNRKNYYYYYIHVYVELSNSDFFFHSYMADSLRFKSRICVYLLISCSNFHTNQPIVSKFEISLCCFSVYLHWIYEMLFTELNEDYHLRIKEISFEVDCKDFYHILFLYCETGVSQHLVYIDRFLSVASIPDGQPH